MEKMKLYTTVAMIELATDNVVKSLSKSRDKLHVIACSALAHVAKHGDIRIVTRFLDQVGGTDIVRLNSLRRWFETFGPITFDGNTAMFDREKSTRLGDAMIKPFWKIVGMEGVAYKPMDVPAQLERFVKSLKKDMIETDRDHRALINALSAARLSPVVQEPLQITLQ